MLHGSTGSRLASLLASPDTIMAVETLPPATADQAALHRIFAPELPGAHRIPRPQT